MEVTLSLSPEQWEAIQPMIPKDVGIKVKNGAKRQVVYTPDFEVFWAHYPRKDAKPQAFGCWNARIAEKAATPAELVLAAKRYGEQCRRDKTEQSYIKLPATFLGTNERWRPYLTMEIQFEGNAHRYVP